MTTHRQYAALPWIDLPEGRFVLLITSRGKGRWLVPKGWPKGGLKGWEVAASEAFEEAGVSGEISRTPAGVYTYKKSLHFFSRVLCSVEVYPLLVTQQRLKWREKGERQLQWIPLAGAAQRADEPGLAEVLTAFATDSGNSRAA